MLLGVAGLRGGLGGCCHSVAVGDAQKLLMRSSALGAHAVVLCAREHKGKESEKGERRMHSQGRKDSHHLHLPKQM